MKNWLLANAFLLGLIGTVSGFLWLGLRLVDALHLSRDLKPYLIAVVSVLALAATYAVGRAAHRVIGRFVS